MIAVQCCMKSLMILTGSHLEGGFVATHRPVLCHLIFIPRLRFETLLAQRAEKKGLHGGSITQNGSIPRRMAAVLAFSPGRISFRFCGQAGVGANQKPAFLGSIC